ncbi:NUDIX domain-containing protein [Desnuesiella massiliensis]|uniref:NUDIX domain-containing protein n=1 Tax=Desnuesiella massiliensis TaxID=1650662 RepID=UPI0006E400F6|nr:NUDIX hydrolase [Desnuesiella massiliensis]
MARNKRRRAQAIIIRDNCILFAYGYARKSGELRHFFVGGGIEDDETSEEALFRELKEEAGVTGSIILKFSKELKEHHSTFLVDIGNQKCVLGYDPEDVDVPDEEKGLQQLLWISLEDKEFFNDIDRDYFRLLIGECKKQNRVFSWIPYIEKILKNNP